MDYEKAYKEAFEKAKSLVDFCSDSELKTLEHVFPELKESEDERKINAILFIINSTDERIMCSLGQNREVLYNWLKNKLKSIRPQSHWRPSEEQMKALRVAIGDEQGSDSVYELRNLLKDLKSL